MYEAKPMLTEPKKNTLKLLIALAWADGRVDETETQVIEELLDSYGANPDEADEIKSWAKQPKSLDDVNADDITGSDAELALTQAVFVTFVDGQQTQKEIDLLNQLATKLHLSDRVTAAILDQAAQRARELLGQMQ
jgi:uncharacterized membrane protein YebE (DUF533 family)